MRKALFIALLLTNSICFGQLSEARRITETLCSKEFYGRGYVNHGDSIAAEFLAEEFNKLGAEPIGDSYFQPFKFDVNTFPSKMLLVQNGKALSPGIDFVVDPSSNGGKYDLDLEEIPTDKVTDVEFISQKLKDVIASNKALVIDLSVLSGDTLKDARAISHELATYVPVIQLIDDKFTWSVAREQRYKLFLQIQKEALDISATLKVDIDAKLIHNYQSRNVIAAIGDKKCAKTIVFTAHYDHLGMMGKEAIFPGGNDNASGTAMLLTMADYFSRNPQKYNVVFIAFAGEEAGLLGSEYFVNHPMIKLKKIDFLVNLDIMGSGEEGITVVNATLHEEEFNLLNKINDEHQLLAKIKKRGPAANSDHYWFTEKGVPSFFIYTMGPNKHYHDVYDTYEELSFNEFEDITTLLIDFVKKLEE